MTAIVPRLIRIGPVRRRNFLLFSSSAVPKSPPLSPDTPKSKSKPVKSVFSHLNDFRAYFKRDLKTGNQLNHVSSEGSPEKEEDKTLQRHDIPGAIDGHTLNDHNEKLGGGKANVDVCCKCCVMLALSQSWIPSQTMNIDETAISIVKAMDVQPELTLKERFILSRKLMSSPAAYAMFKAYKVNCRVAYEKAIAFRADHTSGALFFIAPMRHYCVSKPFVLLVPKSFANENIPSDGFVTLRMENGKNWPVKCCAFMASNMQASPALITLSSTNENIPSDGVVTLRMENGKNWPVKCCAFMGKRPRPRLSSGWKNFMRTM